GHRDERFVGVMIVHLRAMAGLGFAISEIEDFADFERGQLRRVIAHRRSDRAAGPLWRLKADDVEQCTLAAWHLAVGQAAVGAFEILKARDALLHFLTREIKAWKLFHGELPDLSYPA